MSRKRRNPPNDLARQENSVSPAPDQGAGFSVSSVSVEYQGPIPPHVFAEYDKTETGRQFIAVMIAQSQHRMYLEKTVIDGDNKRANWGLVSANFIALIFLGGGIYVTLEGHDWVGGSAIITSISSLVGIFIYGTNSRKQERKEKMETLLGHKKAEEAAKQEKDQNPRLPGL